MHDANHVPPRLPGRRKCLACGLGVAAVLALVTGCAVPLAPGVAPGTAGQESSAANPATPPAANPASAPAPSVDTSDWKSFETSGVGF
ncbi:MAG: hypothetical protein RSG56_11355, partial [Brevundimonas sp.]